MNNLIHRTKLYILESNGEPRMVNLFDQVDLERWADDMTHHNVLVHHAVGAEALTTVFIGIDQARGYGSKPILFETELTQANGRSSVIRQYTDHARAVAGHAELLADLRRIKGVPS